MASKNKEKTEATTEKPEKYKLSVQEQIRRLSDHGMTSARNTIRRLSNPEANQNEEKDEFPTNDNYQKGKSKKQHKNPLLRVRGISGQGLRNSMRKMSNSGSRFLKSILPVSNLPLNLRGKNRSKLLLLSAPILQIFEFSRQNSSNSMPKLSSFHFILPVSNFFSTI